MPQIPVRICIWTLIGSAALTAACTPVHVPAPTVSDLMDDRVALDGALMKCNEKPSGNEALCANARIAVERLARKNEAAEIAQREQDFERNREQLRVTMEKQRAQQEASKPKMDAYSLPLVPVEPANPPPAAAPAAPAPNSG